jgi:hypothetical protein
LVPIARTAVRQTMTIKASMTAYSTAVGPSSETMNFLTPATNEFNMALSFKITNGPNLATDIVELFEADKNRANKIDQTSNVPLQCPT